MSNPSNGGEPSMEEILASIRALVSQDTAQVAAPTAAPAPPQQQRAGVPGATNPAGPVQNKPSLPHGSHAPAPHSGTQARPNAETALGRPDEDDLADLLDEPLPVVVDSGPPAPTAPSIAAAWSPGALGAGATNAPAKGPAENPNSTAAAPMSFDFGSMVPSRDPAPRRDSDSVATPPLSHSPLANLMASPAANAATDSLSAGWPQSLRGGENGAAASKAPTTEMSPPQAKPGEVSPAAFAPKPAVNGSGRPSNATHDKPVTDGNTPSVGSFNAPQGPGGYFPASGTSPAAPAGQDGRPASPSRSEEHKPAALAPSGAGPAFGKANPRAPGREEAASSSFLARGGNAAPPESGNQVASATGYASIEPVLKAFGTIETKVDRSKPGQASDTAIAAEGNTGFKSQPATSSPFSDLMPVPEAASKSAGITAKSGHNGTGDRSLEDAVMHLLRPMLREWLDDNLPRIVEDAVRREVAGAVKNKLDPASKV